MRHERWAMLGFAVLAGVMLCTGCQDPLFPVDTPRSPYERYQALRGEERPMTDAGGGVRSSRPALRERLRPLDQY